MDTLSQIYFAAMPIFYDSLACFQPPYKVFKPALIPNRKQFFELTLDKAIC